MKILTQHHPDYDSLRRDHKTCLENHPVLLYMKGTLKEPLCGFSKGVVDMLSACGVSSEKVFYVDVLNPDCRMILKQVTQWPTFPQLYVNKEFIGGYDIVLELYKEGALQEKLRLALLI